MGGLEAHQPESTPQALVKAPRKSKCRSGGAHVVVTLIANRRRILDDDNNVASFKPLRDAIAEAIGIDDGDRRIRFECGQIETRGRQGVIVKIEHLKI